MLLDGRVAIVAGAGSALGRAVALRLGREGADLQLGGRQPARLDAVADEVRALGRRAEVAAPGVDGPESCQALVTSCLEVFGRADVLVAGALDAGPVLDGTADSAEPGGWGAPAADDLDRWRAAMEATVWGALQMTRAAAPTLRDHGDGRVVLIDAASPVALGDPAAGPHAVAGSALETAVRALAVELGPDGIRVNGVRAGWLWDPDLKARMRALAARRRTGPEAVYREVTADTCLGYLPRPADVAGSVLFLASDLSKPLTGQTLRADAGRGLRWTQGGTP